MKSPFLILALLVGLSAAAQTPEEMYEQYITPETRAILERFEEAERKAREAEAAERSRKTLAISLSILIGLIPVGATGRKIIKGKTWRDNPSGTAKAIAISLIGGVLLAGINYGIFLLRMNLSNL